MNPMTLQALQQKIAESELGQEWVNDRLITQDIWCVKELGYPEEESKIMGIRNIYFEDFFLPWLKLLTKLTIKASVRQKYSLGVIINRITYLKQFDKFLRLKGYNQPELLTDTLLQEFITQGSTYHRQTVIAYVVKLWAEEQWLTLTYTPRKYKQSTPKIETIPEEVLYQIYEKFDLFPPPLERLFRLQLVLGCRIGEMLKMPRQCLKQENNQWFLLRWVQKRKHWRFYQVHSLVAELVREQQKFLDRQFGCDFDFDKLFCKASTSPKDGIRKNGGLSKKRFDVEPIYTAEVLSKSIVHRWLETFREKADLKDKDGNRFNLQSHQFRRTKASIMAHCEAEDEYIAAVLGHGSLDMLPHYRQRSLERLEKEANTKGYVNMYGQVTTFQPRKRRYEKLAELLKVSTPLGECHRPTMLGDCQYRYACLSCDHHRVVLEDKAKLVADFQQLQQDLEQAQIAEQERRVTEINRLLKLLQTRLEGLEKLQNLKGGQVNGQT